MSLAVFSVSVGFGRWRWYLPACLPDWLPGCLAAWLFDAHGVHGWSVWVVVTILFAAHCFTPSLLAAMGLSVCLSVYVCLFECVCWVGEWLDGCLLSLITSVQYEHVHTCIDLYICISLPLLHPYDVMCIPIDCVMMSSQRTGGR